MIRVPEPFVRIKHGPHGRTGAGVVDQDIDPAVFVHHGVYDFLNFIHFTEMGRDHQNVTAEGFDLGSCVFEVIGFAAGDGDLGAGFGKAEGNGLADAAAPAGHDSNFIFQRKFGQIEHCISSLQRLFNRFRCALGQDFPVSAAHAGDVFHEFFP